MKRAKQHQEPEEPQGETQDNELTVDPMFVRLILGNMGLANLLLIQQLVSDQISRKLSRRTKR